MFPTEKNKKQLNLKTGIYPGSFLFYFIYCHLKLLVGKKVTLLKQMRQALVLAMRGI